MLNSARSNMNNNVMPAFYCYVILGCTDTIHHLHAALALGQGAAMHAALLGFVLIPTAIYAFMKYCSGGKKLFFWIFICIAALAIAVPGIYHGGWNHLIKVLAHLRIDSPHTDLRSLFPAKEFHLWFYEITGILEFALAVACLYFIMKLFFEKTPDQTL